MRESFTEYKKTLELNVINCSFIYAGDVINSKDEFFQQIKNTPLTSPSFIRNCIIDIYNKSFQELVSRSKEFVIAEESLVDNGFYKSDLLTKISNLGINNHYWFLSEKKSFLIDTFSKQTDRSLPHYFYESKKYDGLNLDVLQCPLILEDDDETIVYVTDRPIQSLCYVIQNMDYTITKCDEDVKEPHLMTWKHEIKYPFYNCDYNSYKITIKNISQIRNQKINELLR